MTERLVEWEPDEAPRWMRFRYGCVLALILFIGLSYVLSGPRMSTKPWRTRIIDYETGKPVEGVVGVAVWYVASGHSSRQVHEAEAVSDRDGWLTVPAMPPKWQPYFGGLDSPGRAPLVILYKPGYGVRWTDDDDLLPVPFVSNEGKYDEQARIIEDLLSEAASRDLRADRFPFFWQSVMAGYDRLPANSRGLVRTHPGVRRTESMKWEQR